MKKTISIFGSTGTIGKNAMSVILQNPEKFQVEVLVANKNYQILAKQAKILKPKYIAIKDKSSLWGLQDLLSDFSEIKIFAGMEAINDLAKIKCDIFLSAIVGIDALIPTFNAIKAGSNIGLANKECLVAAGGIMLQEAKKHHVKIIPIDSEHNAIFQIFEKDNCDLIDDITLTASGGAFLNYDENQLKNITLEQATKHPNWQMGAKISVDSSTMMNKALEMIEAQQLFQISEEKIKVVIHPNSIIHGLVSYGDGNMLAVMSLPDMKIPISYALFYPDRSILEHKKLDLARISKLEFFPADEERLLPLNLARQVMRKGGNMPCTFNAANEEAVSMFLNGKIKFIDIIKIIVEVLNKTIYSSISSLEEVVFYNQEAKKLAKKCKSLI